MDGRSRDAQDGHDDPHGIRSDFARVYNQILVGYLDNEHGADARALGVELARLTGGDLVLATVVLAFWIERFGDRSGVPVVHSGARERAAAALEAAVTDLAGMPALHRIERRLEVSSSAAFGLHDLAEVEGADLIVLGASHRGTVGRAVLGTVTDRLLHGASCAVAVAPDGHARREHRELEVVGVAFDGSPEARLALRCAHELAARADAALRILTVLEPIPPVLERWIPLPGLEGQELIEREAALERQQQAATETVGEAVQELIGEVDTKPSILRADNAAQALLDAAVADRVDLLVLGSRGYGPVRRTLLGSVSVAVVRAAPVPVLVVPRGVEPGS